MKNYGQVISKLRKKHGLTQNELGKKLNVSYQAVSKWENNLSEPDLDTTQKIAEVFGITMSEFFEMANNHEKSQNTNFSSLSQKDNISIFKTKPWILATLLGGIIFILSLIVLLIPVKYSSKQVFAKYDDSIFFISANTPSTTKTGTGFFINNSGLAVTTYSNVQNCISGKIQLCNGDKYDIEKIVGIDEENDIVLIQVNIDKSFPVKLGDSNNIKMGDKVYSITYSSDDTLNDANSLVTEGFIFKLESNSDGTTSIQTTASIENANKGGVIFDEYGKVVGIISSKLKISGVGFDMVNVCIPIAKIKKIEKNINLSLYDYLKSQNGTYVVQFDGNGSTSGEMSTRTLLRNQEYRIACEFEKTGYMFQGWSHNDTDQGTSIFNLGVENETITLTAIWKEIEIDISYYLNGGYNNSQNKSSLKYWDENFTLLPATKAGHVFEGWYTDPNFSSQIQVINAKTSTKHYSLYAKYTLENYQISYELNGGTNNDLNPASYTINDSSIYLQNPEKLGYKFDGWYKSQDFSGSKVSYISTSQCTPLTLYAKFTAIQYNIDYECNGGACTIEIGFGYYTIEKGTMVSYIKATKDGYTFAGWYNNEDLSGDPVDTVAYRYGYLGDITLYAKYEVINYKINYSLNLGTAPQNGNPTTYTIEDEIVLNEPTKPGCTFYSWYETTNYEYLAKIPKGTTGNLSLSAKYKVLENDDGDLIITTNEALLEFLGDKAGTYKYKRISLESNLDLSAYSTHGTYPEFNGSFNGNYHTISNLKAPLFNETTTGAIQNLKIENINTTKSAGLVQDADRTTFVNCFVQGIINFSPSTLGEDCGGLIAKARNCRIENCATDVNITYTATYNNGSSLTAYIGGLVGFDYLGSIDFSTIKNCYSMGQINIIENANRSASFHVGGLVGQGKISYSYSTCDITANFNYNNYSLNAGGLMAAGNAVQSYATGNITASFKDTSRIEFVKIANLNPSYSDEKTDALTLCYYSNNQTLNTESTIVSNPGESDMESIWQYVCENWYSNIWNISTTSNPTLNWENQE
ncbi:MAG: InlB B-repeat-containing protein [Clostridia bacterium]|nr:InlB B-repeat-containing protein [Clostridia bacterium]